MSVSKATVIDAFGWFKDLITADVQESIDVIEPYTLPTASRWQKGGVKIGGGLSMSGDTLNVTLENYTLPTASTTQKGGVIVGDGLEMQGDTLNVTIDSGETYSEATTLTAGLMPATDKAKLDTLSNYTLPTASTLTKGGIIVGSGLEMQGDTLNATLSGGSTAIISDFSGASASSAGLSGLVPAPQAGDSNKFLCGNGNWEVISGGGASYPIASASQAGLMSAEDKQHLDAVFQDSADFTDAVITVVGGNFLPSVDSVSDFNSYKDSNLPFLDNRLKKVIENPDNPYDYPKESWVFQDGTVTISLVEDGYKRSLVSSNDSYVTLASDTATLSRNISNPQKLSETAGFLYWLNTKYTGDLAYDYFGYVVPVTVKDTGKVGSLAAASIYGAASSIASNNAFIIYDAVPSITDSNHILFASDHYSGGNTTYSYTTIAFNAATGAMTRTKALTNIGTYYTDWASKTSCNLIDSFRRPSISFDEEQIIIARGNYVKLPLFWYALDVYNASSDITSSKEYVLIHHGLYGAAPAVLQLNNWTPSGGYTDVKPWLEDDNNLIAGIYKTKSSPLCYAITFKRGTYAYSDDWYDKCSTVWKFDFLTPAIIKTTLKLSEVIDDLLL